MHILMITQWYSPEPVPLIHELAEGLARAGNHVTVLTGYPNYPGGRIYDGYQQRVRSPVEHLNGIRVIRVPLYPSRSMHSFHRALSYISFALSACVFGLARTHDVDVVWAYQPPPAVILPAMVARARHGSPIVYDIQDMWPETLTASGVLEKGRIARLLEFMMRLIYSAVDHIRVITPGFVTLLEEKRVPAAKITYLPNWAPDAAAAPRSRISTGGRFEVLYAGNLGPAQRLDVIVDAFRLLATELGQLAPRLTLLGDGPMEEELRGMVKRLGLTNVRFCGRVPSNEVCHHAAEADALVVHLADDPLFSHTIPSKLPAYLSMGRPVLAGLRGDGAEVVVRANCGFTFTPERADDARQAVQRMASLPRAELDRMGHRARAAYEQGFARERILTQYTRLIADVASRG